MLIKEIVLYLRQCSKCLLRILKALVTQMGFALSLWPRLAAEFFPQIPRYPSHNTTSLPQFYHSVWIIIVHVSSLC